VYIWHYPYEIADRLNARWVRPSDAVVVTGFWRSGTTWLQQIVANAFNSKPVFEPLHPDTDRKDCFALGRWKETASLSDVKAFMPYCRDLDNRPRLRSHLRSALMGQLPGSWVRRDYSIQDIVRKRTVVKFVRAQLLIPVLQEEFGCKLFHIRRDPRSIVASMFRGNWGEWIKNMDIENLLLFPNDGRREIFSCYSRVIKHFNEKSLVYRLTAYWYITEKFVSENIKNCKVISYKKLVKRGNNYLKKSLGFRVKEKVIKKESSTSSRSKKNVKKRLHNWKRDLNKEKIKRVEKTVEIIKKEIGEL